MNGIHTQMSGRLAISGEVGPSAEARLREACAQFEGVFTQQLLKAMRETVPEDGVLSGGLGEELFNGLFDQHLAEEAALRQSGGLGEILYQQLHSAMAHTIVSTAVLDGKER